MNHGVGSTVFKLDLQWCMVICCTAGIPDVCMYVCMCLCVYMYVYVYVCICMCVCVCIYVYVYMYVCVCMYVFMCVCMYVCVYMYNTESKALLYPQVTNVIYIWSTHS